MSRRFSLVAVLAFVLVGQVASASAADPVGIARNIIPSGQWGGLPLNPNANSQALMYDGLTPLFDKVKNPDLNTYFKSEKFGVSGDGPTTNEMVPRAGVTITRDRFNVPHVKATTYNGGVWASGWIAAEDRNFLMLLARYNARVAAVDPPGMSAVGLITAGKNFVPSAATEAVVAKQADVLKKHGKEGRAVLRDIDTYISGINDYFAINDPSVAPWTRTDIIATNALKDQFLGEGGGDEARRSQFLGGLQDQLGAGKGKSVFNDLRQHVNNGSPTTVDGRFPYEQLPKNGSPGSVVLDAGSYVPTPAVAPRRGVVDPVESRTQASNTLMISAKRSTTGKPLMVGGPQIGYLYPGFTYEIDMNAPNLKWRGATSIPFPGYLLIGRGKNFANTLTSASGDVIDQFAETLCDGSDEKYLYKGDCLSMSTFNAGVLKGVPDKPVTFLQTVHGPVTGYATVNGVKVAIASQRSSRGKDVVDLLFNRRLSNGAVHSPKTFFKAAAKTPQTFNSFYIDNKHLAEFTSGKLPIRSPKTDPSLPTKGTGNYEWRGYLKAKDHPHGVDPKSGTMVNWNNSVAHRFGAADDQFGRNGSAARVDLLNHELRQQKNKKGKWNISAVTSAMNAAATQDVRAIRTVPLLKRLLAGTTAPNAQAQQMLDLMIAWRGHGGNRLDMDLDGKIDDPGAAVMDGSWTNIADAFMAPLVGTQLNELNTLFSRFDKPPSGQYSGWYQYFDRDIHSLLGDRVTQPLKNKFCGLGVKTACQQAIWQAIADSGAALTISQGTSDPTLWRSSATAERITFAPGILPTTMRYTNRPTGIQQVISFNGH